MNLKLLEKQVRNMIEVDTWYVPALSNISAFLMEQFEQINWVGFYLIKEGRLVLGPFQGKVACIHIEVGKGVCGTAVEQDRVLVIEDVHEFPGHIACDSASNSEIVVPIHKNGEIVGVLDVDSPIKNRFGREEEEVFSKVVEILEEMVCFV